MVTLNSISQALKLMSLSKYLQS
uniref:Uncharacterized protein n=1 Tax=Rhizophora mucronata TaxID=61149 RepID=A0A2P2LYE1_RHIMU